MSHSPTRGREEEDASTARPNKRAKYAAVACVLCKKRKAKCVQSVGQSSCDRCRSNGEHCNFPEPVAADDRFERMENSMAALQRRMDMLQRELHSVRQQNAATSPNQGEATTTSPNGTTRSGGRRQLAFVGRTKPAFSFDVARTSMKEMGLSNDTPAFSSPASPEPESRGDQTGSLSASDPLPALSKDELLTSIAVFREEVDPVYPFVDVDGLIRQVEDLSVVTESTRGMTETFHPNAYEAYSPRETMVLRVVVAIGQVIQLLGPNDVSQQLIESVEGEIFGIRISSEASYPETAAAALMSLYHFHSDEELLAWRTIHFASSMALELGLHRHDTLLKNFPQDEERSWVTRLFWCIYILDRRWSFGTSLPFALQDADIDPELPEPGRSAEYLQSMIKYGRIGSKVWQAFPNFGLPTQAIPEETVSYLEFQVQNWLASIPPPLRLSNISVGRGGRSGIDRIEQRLAALLYLRGNQLRIMLNRHRVLSTENIHADIQGAQRLVDLAVDSIKVLVELNAEGDIYLRQQVAFNHFLLGALAVLFLAVCHERSLFGLQCKDSFYNAIELVRCLSTHSRASKRLWKSVKALQPDAQKLGLHQHGTKSHGKSVRRHQTTTSRPVSSPNLRQPAINESFQTFETGMNEESNFDIGEQYQPQPSQLDIVSDAAFDNLPNDLANWYETWGIVGDEGNDPDIFSEQDLDLAAQHNNQVELSQLFQELISA